MFESVRSVLILGPKQDTGTNGYGVVLTPYLPRIKARKEKNLLKGHSEDETGEVEEVLLEDSSPHLHIFKITFSSLTLLLLTGIRYFYWNLPDFQVV